MLGLEPPGVVERLTRVGRRWAVGAVFALLVCGACGGAESSGQGAPPATDLGDGVEPAIVSSWRFVSLAVGGEPFPVTEPLFLDITEDGFRAATTCNWASGNFGGEVMSTAMACGDESATAGEGFMLQAFRSEPVEQDEQLVFDDGTVRLVYESFIDPAPSELFAALADPSRSVDASALPPQQVTGTVPPNFDTLVPLPSPSTEVDLFLSVFKGHVCVVYGTTTALEKWCHEPRFAAERSIVTNIPIYGAPLFRIALIPDRFAVGLAGRADLGAYSDNLLIVNDAAPAGSHVIANEAGETFTIVVPPQPATTAPTTSSTVPSEGSATTLPVATTAVRDAPAWKLLSDRLEQARLDWATANIGSYQLEVEEHRNYWSAGCTWTTVVDQGVVVETDATAAADAEGFECRPIEMTVSRLHTAIADRLEDATERAAGMFGDRTVVAEFDENGVPVRLEFDLANIVDEESSMTVTFTPEP